MLKDTIKAEIIEMVENNNYEGTYICDLAHEMYNQDYYIIGTYQAKEFLKENFDEMIEALEYYKDNFGDQYPDVTDVEKLATYTVLVIAEQVIGEASDDCKEDIWNDRLEEDENKGAFLAALKRV